ncbi:MAG: ubiquinol-cytochrome c reductase iron-sulfur subunit [Deltaproteobacteria bacterium]|nr:ubiquinol-cytochrome c reductase iron-sulfur subunit [Deltaproteobacteria bacterium]
MAGEATIPGSERVAPKKGKDNLWTRRNFLGFAGWAAFGAFMTALLLSFLRFLYPRVLFEPSPIVKVGRPEEYLVGEVSEKYKESNRLWMVRNGEGIYALLAICTHLGCTPRWLATEKKFKCPCHGSGFKMNGVNFEGPAPRPLERVKISLDPDGIILVDKSKTYRFEKGEWDTPDAFLKLS